MPFFSGAIGKITRTNLENVGMKVCLVRPSSPVSAGSCSGILTPSIGLAYIAAAIREAGHEVSVVDGIGEDPENEVLLENGLIMRGLSFADIVERIPTGVDVVGFSGMFSFEWVNFRQLLGLIRERHEKAFIVAGGEHFTAAAEFSLNQCAAIDAIVLGEGEATITEVLEALEKGETDLSNIPGLVIRKDGGSFQTPTHQRVKEIDDLPNPAWDLIPLEKYLSLGLSYGVNRGRSMPMLASRGCPYQCTFCSSPMMWTTRWYARDIDTLIMEIEGYIAEYQITNVDFYDLTAIVKKPWIVAFCKELLERKIDITWQLPSGTRSEALDEEALYWLYHSGCRNITYAPESGSKKTLREIKKKVKLERMIDSIRHAAKQGLVIKVNIVLGFPDDTHADIFWTFWFLAKVSAAGAHDVGMAIFSPYPGSELFTRLAEEKRISYTDEYFAGLSYVDFTDVPSYCDRIGAKTLLFYTFIGFAIFYPLNYLFRPIRMFRTIRNVLSSREDTRGERALRQMLERFKYFRLWKAG